MNNYYDIAFNESLTFYYLNLSCSPTDRKIVNCTEEFFNKGFLKNLVWDKYAEYSYKCKDCPYFKHDIGFYFGDGHYTNDFSTKETFVISIRNTEDLSLVVENLPTTTKTIWIHSKKPVNYSALEKLTQLQTVCIELRANDVLWDMEKTPDLDVLEIQFGAKAPEITKIKKAKNLRHLGFTVNTSQINNTVIPTLSFLKEMPRLDSLVLSGVAAQDDNIEDLINIPNLKRLWIPPHIYSTEDYAKFESLKFKIYTEFGIYQLYKEKTSIENIRPLGRGKRYFKSEKSKEKFISQYKCLMEKYQ